MPEIEIISPALAALLDIMTSANVPEAKCIEAARAIIEYEAPPGVFDLTHAFLMGVAQNDAQDVGLKLEALKLIRKVEARRVMPGAGNPADVVVSKALARRVAVAKQRLALIKDRKWPPDDSRWAEEIGTLPSAKEGAQRNDGEAGECEAGL